MFIFGFGIVIFMILVASMADRGFADLLGSFGGAKKDDADDDDDNNDRKYSI